MDVEARGFSAIVFVCNKGRHRSVAMVELVATIANYAQHEGKGFMAIHGPCAKHV